MLAPPPPSPALVLLLVPSGNNEISQDSLQELALDAPHGNVQVQVEEEQEETSSSEDVDFVMRERSNSVDSLMGKTQQIRVIFMKRLPEEDARGEQVLESVVVKLQPQDQETEFIVCTIEYSSRIGGAF